MFKIENYVTPIILNYVAKYVKNIRPQDAQLSLWQGEVLFHNLDLRLEVLEEELNLPFEFLSGHIHDLSIRVPWTKITSEPIRIDINTIEFVLKLKDERGDGTGSSTSSSPQRNQGTDNKSRRINKYEDQNQTGPTTSSGSGLVNKIINNIAVQCHNIILKYVEEDIVVSMNVQLLSFSSADDEWKPAMVDVHPVKVFMRKLIQISDLTICLDKRNAAGQIDVCQEPLLYRCTLECRILRKYNIQSIATNSTTRIGILTKSLDLNVSALQFPMAMRLFKLIMALKSGEFKVAKVSSDILDADIEEPESSHQSEGSYLSWVWNLLPSFNFQSAEEENQSVFEPTGHIFDIGVYVEQMNFTLKNAEFVTDSIIGTTKRIRYTPIVRINVFGMYFEKIAVTERNWSSTKAGISSIYVEPLGTYRCDENSSAILDTLTFENMNSYMDKSLFDLQYVISDKIWGVSNYEEYKTYITDEYLLYRSPILAIDIIEYNPSGNESAEITEETSNDNHVEYRLLSSGFTFRYNAAFLQVKHIVNEFISSYDYPAYYAERLDSVGSSANAPKLHPPLMEDYDSLMQHIPLRTYKFDLKKVRVELHARMEPSVIPKCQHKRTSVAFNHALPFLVVYLEQVEGEVSTPLNPDKLVHTTCQLPDKPNALLNACYNNYEILLKDLSVSLVKTGFDESRRRLLYIPKLQSSFGDLLQSDLWKSEEIALKKLDVNCEKLILDVTKKDVIITERLIRCIISYQHNLLSKIVRQISITSQSDPIRLQSELNVVHVQQRCYKQHKIWNVCLRGMQAFVVIRRLFEEIKHLLFTSLSKPHNNQQKWLEWQGQFPVGDVDVQLRATMGLWVDRFNIFMDSTLIDFLEYQEEPEMFSRETLNEIEIQTHVFQPASLQQSLISQNSNTSSARRTSRHSLPARKVSHPEETIHFSSERDDKVDIDAINSTNSVNTNDTNQMYWIKYMQSLIFLVEIGQGKLNIAKSFRRAANGQIISEFTEILLPKIACKSTHAEYISRSNMWQKIVPPATSTSNWKLSLNDFSIQHNTLYTTETILEPIQTTIIIALTHKKEKIKSTQKQHLEVFQVKKIAKKKYSPESHLPIDTKSRDTRKTGSDNIGSVSADGRTNSIDEEEFDSNDGVSATQIKNEEYKETLDSTKKQSSAQKNIVTLTLHADTTSILFFFSSEKVEVMHDHLGIVLRVLQLYNTVDANTDLAIADPIQILTSTEENTSLKEFLDLETSSESSKITEDKTDALFVASLFCQWTVTKITIELETGENLQKCKIIMELEDLLSTVDKHEDFSKYTSKMGNFSLNYYEPNNKGDWESQECLRLKMFAETANLPFFNIIYTCVGLKSFYSRIGAKRKGDLNRTISEVVITMQAIEVIMDLDTMIKFVVPICVLFQKKPKKTTNSKSKSGIYSQSLLSTLDLPLLHLDCKGFTLYMPLDTEKKACSVVIWKLEGIKITPNLENPLQRNPLRSDVYNKATQMGILSTPGALIEDRQYELTLRNISAATGNWDQILSHMREQVNNFLRTNPAFEWNNQNRKTALQLTELFNNFKFIAIYAPCIVYNNILICGQALEFNCASDFTANINTLQLQLLCNLLLRFKNISRIINDCRHSNLSSFSQTNLPVPQNSYAVRSLKRPSKSMSTFYSIRSQEYRHTYSLDARASSAVFDSIDEDTEHNFKTDSGFQSHNSQAPSANRIYNKERLSSIASSASFFVDISETKKRHVPQTVSLVAGVFIVKIFDISYDLDYSTETEYKPLFAFTITQPSFISTQNIYDSTMQVSLYNFNIHMGSAVYPPIQKSPNANLFPESLFETRSGELSSTGIPPPLLSFKAYCTKKQLLEIDIEVQRPILIRITEEYVHHLCKSILLIYNMLFENPLFSIRTEQTITRGSKIKLIREHVFQADRLYAKFNQIAVKFTNDINYNCKLFSSDIKLNMKFLNRPEKASVTGSIGAIYMQAEKKIFLHPVTLRYSVDFISEPWHRLPLIVGVVKLNVLRIDIGINGIIQLREALQGFNRINTNINTEWSKFLKEHQSDCSDLNKQREQLTILKCPKLSIYKEINTKRNKLHREEFYQDDLRAGAFQFVELVTDSFLPLPYQIQIIKKDYGIICWRYPQPRKMSKIYIYPVPMAVANPVRIKCRMEYFSEVHERFQHYCEFWLSETVSKQITLPEKKICANIWRVVILQSLVSVSGESFGPNEEVEELRSISSTTIDAILNSERKEADFILHPKVLVGCMRIDTAFQSDCVPKVQFLVSFNMLQVKLLNQPMENAELPSLLKKFKLAHVSPISQTFLEIVLERVNINSDFYTKNNYTVASSMNCHIKCLDYGFLNMLYLMEPSTFQCHYSVDMIKHNMTVNLVLDRIRLNLGPTVVHSLLSSKMHWDELLEQPNAQKRHALIPKCIVVNRTMSHLSFGQTGTTERIHLQPRECHLYSFRSDYHSQELTVFVADEESRIIEVSQSVPLPIKYDGDVLLQTIRIGNKCIIIKSKRLSATQIFVLIKGQIELISMVDHDLRVEFRREGKQPGEKHVQEYAIDANGRYSYYGSVHSSSNIVMRLKFGSHKGKGRSGDIPLRANKNLPWLVKVPTQNNNDFVSLWVRIIREDITEASSDKFNPQKVLITIWPIFMISSMLSNAINVVENSTNKIIELKPHGGRYALSVPATHLTEHKIDFQYNFLTGDSTLKEYTLTLKTIDWNKFFWYDEEKWNIEYALQELSKGVRLKWPMADEEEMRVKRNCSSISKTDIQFKCMPSREFSCTLCLEMSPWAFFINTTGLPVSICGIETEDRILIDSNYVAAMFRINKSFTVNIENSSNWIASLPIYCDSVVTEHKSGRYLLLTENSFVDIVLLRDDQVLKFVLELKVEDERKIFKLRSKYVVTNFTKSKLYLLPFSMDHKESVGREDVIKYDLMVRKCDLEFVYDIENSIGLSMDYFYDLNSKKATRTIDTAFVCFACIKVSADSHVSIPIPLSLPFTRRCFSVQYGEESMPLVVTLTDKDNVYYLNIFDDVSPAIFINNQTDVKFIVAQTSASENSKVTNTTPEYEGRHFEWFQLLPAQSKCYYTPPEMYSNFPDVESTMCNLTFALFKENARKNNIKWSKPIRTDKTWEKFLHVPNHGDVKVTICDKHRVIRVSIYYIAQQLEFSVKDLRSRLLTPAVATDTNQLIYSTPEESSIEENIRSMPTPTCIHFQQECEMKMQLKFRVYAKEFMFSLHTDAKDRDYMKCEVFSMYMDDVVVAYDEVEDCRQMNVLIANLQLDNQLHSTGKYDFPVVLCSQELYTRSVSMPEVYYLEQTYQELCSRQPMLLFTLTFFADELKIDSIDCKLSPLRAYIEDAYLNDLFEALLECEPFNCIYKPKQEYLPLVLHQGQVLLPRDVVAESCCIAEPLQLRSFRIEPLTVLLSVHTSVRLYIALDHSPLSFSTYERQRILTMPLRFGQSVGMHFLSGAIFGAGWVVGSLEILGSPSGLARSFTNGLRDFVSMPMQGLFRGPWGFIIGITQGSASLLRNVTAGTVNSVTKLAASVARNLDRLTLDQEHIERTEALRRSRPQGFAEGFSQGITGLGISILGAVGGIAHHTLEARSPVEVVTGMGKGIVGALTKPLSGAAELLALAGQGVLHTVGFNAMPQQRSPSVCHNIAVGPSGYRIWKLLPPELSSDQILFHHEVTLLIQDQLRRGFVFLTSAVFALLEAQWDRLALVLPIKKVDISCDRDDKTLLHVRIIKETDDIEEDISYTNQRIMSFLRSSFSVVGLSAITTDSLDDLLQTQGNQGQNQEHSRGIDWTFYINEQLGAHIIQYLNIINHHHNQT